MYYIEKLEKKVFIEPYYDLGFRNLSIVTGYASSSFLYYILNRYPDIKINLVIGMARKDGISRWDHEKYKEVSKENPNIDVYYRNCNPGVHTKIYHWEESEKHQSKTFVGSANFSWNGFRNQVELLVESNHLNIDEVLYYSHSNIIDCTDPGVEDVISIYDVQSNRKAVNKASVTMPKESTSKKEKIDFEYLGSTKLSLIIDRSNSIHQKSGLNWGQRPGRESNQAYIPVSTLFNRENPDFFPALKEDFIIITDDNEYLMCVMAQQNRKAIHTSNDNSIIGKYFRRRLGVALGKKVELADLLNYGRTDVEIFKIDNETYYMDFSVT